MTGWTKRSLLLLCATSVTACGRARAEPTPVPVAATTGEPVTAAPAFSGSAPVAPPTPPVPKLTAREHDRALLPCPEAKALCEPDHPLLARGVLARAEAYLRNCRECRQRDLVSATKTRSARVVARAERDARRRNAECVASHEIGIFVTPDSVVAGESARVVVAAAQPLGGQVEVTGSDGSTVTVHVTRNDGWFHVVETAPLTLGRYSARVRDASGVRTCTAFTVSERRRARLRRDGRWLNRRGWDGAAESLYAAWVAHAFDAPEGTRWQGFGPVLTDRKRNLLHNHVGLAEDDDASRLALRPDCADAPYVLRAYFAWKLGLPFGHHRCNRGEIDGPPRCGDFTTNADAIKEPAPDAGAARLSAASRWDFRELAEGLLDDVTARSLRPALDDDTTDLYPLALAREALRPGTVFSDPYGHTLTLVKWQAQTDAAPGKLLAVDAQPDGTVGIRRFWRGNFLFVDDHPLGGFGFKAFRPIVIDGAAPRLLTNAEIAVADGYGRVSLEQRGMGAAEFYARMARLISPRQPPPEQELDELVAALAAQLERRVTEVENAEPIVAARKTPIEMPEGREMFRTTGAWEAVSTPCRDLRLLVGIDALLAFPAQAATSAGEPALKARLTERLDRALSRRTFAYTRSNGSRHDLTLAQIVARRALFEMAYNPNDCPELRWGAAEGSPEAATCTRRAPAAQRRAMERMRHWFVKRYACG